LTAQDENLWAQRHLFDHPRGRQQFGHDNTDYQHPNQAPSFIKALHSEAVQRGKQERCENQGAAHCAQPTSKSSEPHRYSYDYHQK
jgi:hypothetical protein